MADSSSLYHDVLLDHYRRPRNFHEMADATRVERGHNPACGDDVTVWLRIEDGVVADVSFKGVSCAVTRASASMMTTLVKGKTLADAEALFDRFQQLVMGQIADAEHDASLGGLRIFAGVSRLPMKVKCAILPWHALRAALRPPAGG
ncbi:MAG: Fe-S cluster assembly sulfur transfer protein SufU [Gemmatimonadaceae bacterium]